MSLPSVVRLKRKNGQIVQDCDVYIGRACSMGGWDLPQSPWHNPFRLQDYNNDRQKVLELYRSYVLSKPNLVSSLCTLQGKRLGCWCHNYTPTTPYTPNPFYCHGDVLIDLLFQLQNSNCQVRS